MDGRTHIALQLAEQNCRREAEVLYRHAEQARRDGAAARALRLAREADHAEQRAARYAGRRVEVIR